MRAIAALFVIALAGCSETPGQPFLPIYQDSYAQLVAVTALDSVTADGLVPMVVHWRPQNCTERLISIEVREVPRYWTLISLRTTLVPFINCPAGDDLVARDTTIDVRVPGPGELPVIISGLYGAVDVAELRPILPSVDFGQHGIRVVWRGASSLPDPVPNVVVEHRSGPDGGSILASATSDSTGWTVSAPACSPNADGSTFVVVEDPLWLSSTDVLRFEVPFCRHALRTVLLYGPPPRPPDARKHMPRGM